MFFGMSKENFSAKIFQPLYRTAFAHIRTCDSVAEV